METRQITQIKIYRLLLNPMRGKTEGIELVAVAYDKQNLIEWYNSQKAEKLIEDVGTPSFKCHGDSHTWHKTFKIGSPLEWFNPIDVNQEPNYHGHGIDFQWATREDFDGFLNRYKGMKIL